MISNCINSIMDFSYFFNASSWVILLCTMSWSNLFDSTRLITLWDGLACKLLFLASWILFFLLLNLFLSTSAQTGSALSEISGSFSWNSLWNGKAVFSNALMTLSLFLYDLSALINVSSLDSILSNIFVSYSFKWFSKLNILYWDFFASCNDVLPLW